MRFARISDNRKTAAQMHGLNPPVNKRALSAQSIIRILFILLISAAWLWFAIKKWNWDGRYYRTNIKADYIDRFLALFSGYQGKSSAKIYLDLAPFLFFAFYLTVLVPDVIKRFVKWSRKFRLIYWLCAGCLLFCAVLCMLTASTTLHSAIFHHIGRKLSRFISGMNEFYAALTPVSLILSAVTWFLPCAGKTIYDWFHEPKQIRRSLLRAGLSIVICLAIGFFITAASAAMLAVLNAFSRSAVSFVDSFCKTDSVYIGLFIVSVILAPVIEEVAFRGLIQNHLRNAHLPFAAALLYTAVSFGLWHRNLGQFVYTFLFALVVGTVYERCGLIRYTILIHFCMNFSTILAYSDRSSCIFGKLRVLPGIKKFIMGLNPVPGGLFFVAMAAVIILLLKVFSRIWRSDNTMQRSEVR